MDDPERIVLQPPLPGNALAATVTFLAPRGGLAPGFRAVPRSQATHAELEVTGLSGRAEERRMEIAQAEEWLAEAAALHARSADLDAAARDRRDEADRERAALVAAISLDCARCGVPREHAGRHHLMTTGAPDQLAATGEHFGKVRASAVVLEMYACPRCGSVELFRPLLPHPLPAD